MAAAVPLAAPSTGTTVHYDSCVGTDRTFSVTVSGGGSVNVTSTVDGGSARSWTDSPITLTAAAGQTVAFHDGFGTAVGRFVMPDCSVDYAADVAENGNYVFDKVPGATPAAPAPAHGTVVAVPDGTLRYTPTPGYTGPDSFGYTAAGAAGTVAITVVAVDGTETFTWSGCLVATITNHTDQQHSYTWTNAGVAKKVATLAPGQSGTVQLQYGTAGEFNTLTSDSGRELASWVPDTWACATFEQNTVSTPRDTQLVLDPLITFEPYVVRQPEHGTLVADTTGLKVTYTPDSCYVGDDYFVYGENVIDLTHFVTVHVTGSPCVTTSSTPPTTNTPGTVPTSGSSTSAASSTATRTSSAAVVPLPSPPEQPAGLASTGVNPGPMLAGGALLILSGFALVRIGRRRPAHHS
jgi:hypothetical protein